MTSHKPFTAEQLDELEQELELCTYVRLRAEYLPEDSGKLSRLIAQAREEIRLRKECGRLAVAADKATCAYEALLGDDPAARAKRELGELLIREHVRVHRNGPSWVDEERFTCELQLDVDRFVRHGATEHEAITAALRAAKEQLASFDPAARAKRELGEWLATDYHSRKARLQTRAGDRFRMALYGAKSNPYVLVTGEWCATEYEAITTALRAAKESGR